MVKKILFFFFLFIPSFCFATLQLPLNLEEITLSANRIFLGKVISSWNDTWGGEKSLPAMVTTFQVIKVLHGSIKEKEFSIRQVGRVGPKNSFRLLMGPRFWVGQTVLVFLSPTSSLGLTSPIGLNLGVFKVQTKTGQTLEESFLSNPYQNRGLLQGITNPKVRSFMKTMESTQGKKEGPLWKVKDMEQMIRHILESKES